MRIWGMWCPAAFSLKRDEVLLLRNITSILVFLESRDKLISSVIYCDKLKHIWSLRATKWVKRKKYRTSNTWWSPVFLYLYLIYSHKTNTSSMFPWYILLNFGRWSFTHYSMSLVTWVCHLRRHKQARSEPQHHDYFNLWRCIPQKYDPLSLKPARLLWNRPL